MSDGMIRGYGPAAQQQEPVGRDDDMYVNPLLAPNQRREVTQMLDQDAAGGVSGYGVVQRDGGTGRGFQPTDLVAMAEQVETLASELQEQATETQETATATGITGIEGAALRTLVQQKELFDDTITEMAETDHGRIPQDTNDAAERDLANKSKDIGYGHKIKASEHTSGKIHGITFKNQDGTFRNLTDKDIKDIYKADLKSHTDSIRAADWDEKLKDKGSSWAKLPQSYRLALSSLAYNVGKHSKLKVWDRVFDEAINQDPTAFARELRRTDVVHTVVKGVSTTEQKFTAGTDNRVLREMFAAGFINSESDFDDIKAQLPKATDLYNNANGYID